MELAVKVVMDTSGGTTSGCTGIDMAELPISKEPERASHFTVIASVGAAYAQHKGNQYGKN